MAIQTCSNPDLYISVEKQRAGVWVPAPAFIFKKEKAVLNDNTY